MNRASCLMKLLEAVAEEANYLGDD